MQDTNSTNKLIFFSTFFWVLCFVKKIEFVFYFCFELLFCLHSAFLLCTFL